MAKRKNTKVKHPSARSELHSGKLSLENYAHRIFQEQCNQFLNRNSGSSSVYEGLDLDPMRVKRRISAALAVAEDIKVRFAAICPDIPGKFSLAEDWITVNAYPISSYDYVEKYIFSTLGAAIWILDYLRDNGKLEDLKEILQKAPAPGDVPMPDVWDPCHSQQLLMQMVSIINVRNQDFTTLKKAAKKGTASSGRIYMSRETAENNINRESPSRVLYDQILSLIPEDELSAIETKYEEIYWDWLRRYFLCREIFVQEEMQIREEIQRFQTQMAEQAVQNTARIQQANPFALLAPSSGSQQVPGLLASSQTAENHGTILYRKQEEFNARFGAFSRDVAEIPFIPPEVLSQRYGDAIAEIWAGFGIRDPYSMCMAFLLLLDKGSDLPWCYFAGTNLQYSYACTLPWTRTRHIDACDDIWEHYDALSASVVAGPSPAPLSKKIKIPEIDDWYQMQYLDSARKEENTELFNLSHILYEVTGCLMPRKLDRFSAALDTLHRYGINNKKANLNLLYCMALLGEAKHQSVIRQVSPAPESMCTDLLDLDGDPQAQVVALHKELLHCRQALQDAAAELSQEKSQRKKLQQRLEQYHCQLQDTCDYAFGHKQNNIRLDVKLPYCTASRIVVFAADSVWIEQMQRNLPNVAFFQRAGSAKPELFRNAYIIWIQPQGMTYDTYQRIVTEAGKYETPVRMFSTADISDCTKYLIKADMFEE